jgi:hypothetical protein
VKLLVCDCAACCGAARWTGCVRRADGAARSRLGAARSRGAAVSPSAARSGSATAVSAKTLIANTALRFIAPPPDVRYCTPVQILIIRSSRCIVNAAPAWLIHRRCCRNIAARRGQPEHSPRERQSSARFCAFSRPVRAEPVDNPKGELCWPRANGVEPPQGFPLRIWTGGPRARAMRTCP